MFASAVSIFNPIPPLFSLKTEKVSRLCSVNMLESRYSGPRDAAAVVTWALTTTPSDPFVPGKNAEMLKAREEAQSKRVPWETYDNSLATVGRIVYHPNR
jgi:hypothetical protein